MGATLLVIGDAASFIASGGLLRSHEASSPPLPDLPNVPTQSSDWIDLGSPVTFSPHSKTACSHTDHIHEVTPSARGCEECLKTGDRWVHLRICMECGHVGCCDSSPGKHATAHFHATGHPIARSIEPGETWGWCYKDEVML